MTELRDMAEALAAANKKPTAVEKALTADHLDMLRAEATDPDGIGPTRAHAVLVDLGYDLTSEQVRWFFRTNPRK